MTTLFLEASQSRTLKVLSDRLCITESSYSQFFYVCTAFWEGNLDQEERYSSLVELMKEALWAIVNSTTEERNNIVQADTAESIAHMSLG